MYALDTNSVIYFFKGLGNIAERLLETPPREIALPSVVLYELEVGLAKSGNPTRRRNQLEELLSVVELLPFGKTEARASAKLRSDLELRGTPIGPMDLLIAGTALSHGAVLVTRNVREFERVAGLRVEDWY